MKKLTVVFLIAVFCVSLYGAIVEQTKEQQLTIEIGILKSKIFFLEQANKKLKKDVEGKDKAIIALALRLASKPLNTTPKTYSRSNGVDYRGVTAAQIKARAEAQAKANKNRIKENDARNNARWARLIKTIYDNITRYKSEKYQAEREYKNAVSNLRRAEGTIGKKRRKSAVSRAYDNKKNSERKLDSINNSITRAYEQINSYKNRMQ